jgi:hypothetical protein
MVGLTMTWAHVDGNAANTSFADVATQAAVRDEWRVPDVRDVAAGAIDSASSGGFGPEPGGSVVNELVVHG